MEHLQMLVVQPFGAADFAAMGHLARIALGGHDDGEGKLVLPGHNMALERARGRGVQQGQQVEVNLWDPIWIVGTLKIENVESPYGMVGYQVTGQRIEPYEG